MSTEELDYVKGEIAETKGYLNAEKAKLEPNPTEILSLRALLTAQQNTKNIYLARAAGKLAFFR